MGCGDARNEMEPGAPNILIELEDGLAGVVLRALCAHLSDPTVEWNDAAREAVGGLAWFIHDQLPEPVATVPPVHFRFPMAA